MGPGAGPGGLLNRGNEKAGMVTIPAFGFVLWWLGVFKLKIAPSPAKLSLQDENS
jgi:hypothetical protein